MKTRCYLQTKKILQFRKKCIKLMHKKCIKHKNNEVTFGETILLNKKVNLYDTDVVAYIFEQCWFIIFNIILK